MIKFARISPPHLELNIVLNIQSPGYYADSLNVKGQHYKLNVETPFFFTLFYLLIYIHGKTAGALPHTLGENPKYMLLFLFTESLA